MASAITLEGIDQAISNLRYKNKNTLKYRYVHQIRQYYTSEKSVVFLNEIEHEELIKMLWDTDHSPETIKNKRKNLNSVRSTVNADLKKLYEKGENSEGIKIGPSNIFVMSEDAKDKILKKFGYDLQPDGTLKLDRIMDILKLANETVSGSMAVEDTERKDGLKKIDRLKDLIKGLSEKVGLGHSESSKNIPEFDDIEGKGYEQGSGSMENAEELDEEPLDEVEDIEALEDEVEVVDEVEDTAALEDEVEVVDEVEDIEALEDEVEVVDEVEDAEELDGEEIIDDIEDVEIDEIADTDTDDLVEADEVDEVLEDVLVEEDTELGDDVEEVDDVEANSNIKKNKLLSEEFDGYLGSMDRYYNHYILIPGGEYLVGSKHPEKDEKPEEMIVLEPYYFGRFPITNGLFEIFVEKTGYKTTAEKFGYGTVYYGRFEKKKDEKTGLITSTWNSSLCCKTIKGACWYQPSGAKSTLYNKRNHPVVQVSMEDAMAFAAWTGKRLPTENEWEAASRTENGWIFPWGQEWKEDACNIEDCYTADTTPVDKYVEFENDYGIVDTIGNVLEWTNDSFDSTSKRKHGAKYRAVRGGSWISGNDIRSFSRFMIEPESHSNILGFRCVAY